MKHFEINYNQVFSTFQINPTFESDFCMIFEHKSNAFALHLPSESSTLKCVDLSTQSLISPIELYYLFSNFISFSNSQSSYDVTSVKEYDTIIQWVDTEKVINFAYGLVNLTQQSDLTDHVVRKTNLIVSNSDNLEHIYTNKNRSYVSFVLADKEKEAFQIIDFGRNYFAHRLNGDRAFWTSNYFSNNKAALIAFNPLCLIRFFEDSIAEDYFSVVLSPSDNPLLFTNDVTTIFEGKSLENIQLLYSESSTEIIHHLKLVVCQINLNTKLNIALDFNEDKVIVQFLLDADADVTPLVSFYNGVQKTLRNNVFQIGEEESNLFKSFCFYNDVCQSEHKTIFSIYAMQSFESLEALLIALIKLSKFKWSTLKVKNIE